MLSFLGDVILVTELNSLVVNSDLAVTTILSHNDNVAELVSWCNFDTFGVLEANLSGLVIINDGNSSFSILAYKLSIGLMVVKLNKEILIWLPVIIILDFNVESF